MDPVFMKLEHAFGPVRAHAIWREILAELGLEYLKDADERVGFGQLLIARGGLLALIGRSVVTQAILHGASQSLARIEAMRVRTSRPPPSPH